MLYTIAEVSNLIHLSKVSIYKKLKLKELQEHITKNQGITYINEIGLNLIRNDLKNNKDDLNDLNNKGVNNSINDDIATDSDSLNLKDDYINYLKLENERLWNELKEKNLQLSQEQELTKNMQILQIRQQPQDIKALEEHFKDLDNKLVNIKEKLNQKKNQEHKGIWDNLFKK